MIYMHLITFQLNNNTLLFKFLHANRTVSAFLENITVCFRTFLLILFLTFIQKCLQSLLLWKTVAGRILLLENVVAAIIVVWILAFLVIHIVEIVRNHMSA